MVLEETRAAGTTRGSGPNDVMMGLLDDEGLTSVVATNCEQQYGRPLVVGDRLVVRSVIESISDPKRTALGTGRFVTNRMDYVAVPDADVPAGEPVSPEQVHALFDAGEPVATQRFRILKYLPPDRPASNHARPPRPRPAITQDNAFWFEGARAHRLLIQRCTSCGTLRHPPLPACARCGSLEWDTVESSGRGTLYSYVVVHYPQVAAFEYPLPIGLVELEEGTRVVANLGGVEPEAIEVGMELRAEFVDHDEELLAAGLRAGWCWCWCWCRRGEWCLMDFHLSDEQLAVAEAATGVFGGLVDAERIGAIEQTDDRIDRVLWQALADADLLGIAVPESDGGAGYGLMELCLLLEAQGNAVAPVPLWATLVLGALPIARLRLGCAARPLAARCRLRRRDPHRRSDRDGSQPDVGPGRARRRRAGEGWALEGTELAVPQAHLADRIVVPARTDGRRVLLALVDPMAGGVWLERAVTTNREVHPHLHLAGVTLGPEDILVGPDMGRPTLDFLMVAAHRRPVRAPGRCMRGRTDPDGGLPERPPTVRAPAQHLPGHHAASGGRRHRHRGAARRRARALPGVSTRAGTPPTPPMWPSGRRPSAGSATVHATQHLHGGIGADITYPIHRYFLWGKQIELPARWPERPAGAPRRGDRRAGAGGGGGRAVTVPSLEGPTFFDVSVGDELPTLVLPITRTLIVSRAIASRDYQDVHHDPVLAKERGSKDIFMNILTTNGFVGRYVTDWSGPRSSAVGGQHPAGRAELPGLHHDLDRLGHCQGAARRRRDERGRDRRRPWRQQPGGPRDRDGEARPPIG